MADLGAIALQLQSLGFVALTIDSRPTDDLQAQAELPRYPDVLALMPSGVTYLLQRPEVDAERIGVVGFGLGGDLALRAAGTDEQIAAAVAVAPCLTPEPCKPGLHLLRHRSLWQAVRWRRRGRAQSLLVEQLDALSFLPRILPRPLLILHSPQSLPPDLPTGVETRSLPNLRVRSPEVAQVIGHWCERNTRGVEHL